MRLIKYAGGLDDDAHTSVLADTPPGEAVGARFFWDYDRAYPYQTGDLSIGLDGRRSGRSPPDTYELIVEAAELGAMLAAVRPEDLPRVMEGFLERAGPEIIGALVGRVVTHLAQVRAERPAKGTPRKGRRARRSR